MCRPICILMQKFIYMYLHTVQAEIQAQITNALKYIHYHEFMTHYLHYRSFYRIKSVVQIHFLQEQTTCFSTLFMMLQHSAVIFGGYCLWPRQMVLDILATMNSLFLYNDCLINMPQPVTYSSKKFSTKHLTTHFVLKSLKSTRTIRNMDRCVPLVVYCSLSLLAQPNPMTFSL